MCINKYYLGNLCMGKSSDKNNIYLCTYLCTHTYINKTFLFFCHIFLFIYVYKYFKCHNFSKECLLRNNYKILKLYSNVLIN